MPAELILFVLFKVDGPLALDYLEYLEGKSQGVEESLWRLC